MIYSLYCLKILGQYAISNYILYMFYFNLPNYVDCNEFTFLNFTHTFMHVHLNLSNYVSYFIFGVQIKNIHSHLHYKFPFFIYMDCQSDPLANHSQYFKLGVSSFISYNVMPFRNISMCFEGNWDNSAHWAIKGNRDLMRRYKTYFASFFWIDL